MHKLEKLVFSYFQKEKKISKMSNSIIKISVLWRAGKFYYALNIFYQMKYCKLILMKNLWNIFRKWKYFSFIRLIKVELEQCCVRGASTLGAKPRHFIGATSY